MSTKATAIEIASQNSGVVGLKLRSGETIIATLIDKEANATIMNRPWKISHPFMLLFGGGQADMMPWLPTERSHPEMLADLNDMVVIAFAPAPSLVDGYLQATGQKRILTPDQKNVKILV